MIPGADDENKANITTLDYWTFLNFNYFFPRHRAPISLVPIAKLDFEPD